MRAGLTFGRIAFISVVLLIASLMLGLGSFFKVVRSPVFSLGNERVVLVAHRGYLTLFLVDRVTGPGSRPAFSFIHLVLGGVIREAGGSGGIAAAYLHLLPVAVLTSIAPVFWTKRFRRANLQSRRTAAGCCPMCGYDLRGGSDRCPECGQSAARFEATTFSPK